MPKYVRNPGELWDVLVIVGNGPIDDVSSYVDGTKTMSVDVYSPAPGIPVQITLKTLLWQDQPIIPLEDIVSI